MGSTQKLKYQSLHSAIFNFHLFFDSLDQQPAGGREVPARRVRGPADEAGLAAQADLPTGRANPERARLAHHGRDDQEGFAGKGEWQDLQVNHFGEA